MLAECAGSRALSLVQALRAHRTHDRVEALNLWVIITFSLWGGGKVTLMIALMWFEGTWKHLLKSQPAEMVVCFG